MSSNLTPTGHRLRGEWRVCIALGIAASVLYLATLSHRYTGDSLWFAIAVDAESWRMRIDPYHLLLHPLGWLWVQLWRALGWTGPSIEPLEALNALGGGVAVAFACSIAARTSGSLRAGALGAAGCAVSGGLWLFGTEAEDASLGLAAHLAVLALLLRVPAGGYAGSLASLGLGVALGAGALTYLNCALLCGVAALAHWQGRGVARRWFGSLVLVALGFLLVLIPAALFNAWMRNQRDPFVLDMGRDEYGLLQVGNVPRGLYAFLRMLVLFPGLGLNDRTTDVFASAGTLARGAFLATYATVAVLAVTPLVLTWKHRDGWSREVRGRLLLWAVLYAAFAFWWVPSDLEFWLPVAVGWWFPVALLVARGAVSTRSVAAVGTVLLVVNGLGVILPHADVNRNAPLLAAKRVAAQLRDGDAVAAEEGCYVFLRYFFDHEAVRIRAERDLATAVAKARRRAAKPAGRVFLAGVPLDESQRASWKARLVFSVGDQPVWELPAE